MIATIPLLNKPEELTINKRVYDKESYITAIKKHIDMYNHDKTQPPLSSYDPRFETEYDMVEFCTINPMLRIGDIIQFNEEDFTVDVKIYEQFEECLKDLSSYYIQLRLIGESTRPDLDGNPKFIIERIVSMELNNNPANIVKKEVE